MPPALLQSTEFFDNLVLLVFPLLSDVFTFFGSSRGRDRKLLVLS